MLQSNTQQTSGQSRVSEAIPSSAFLLNPNHARRVIGRSQLWSTFKKELFLLFLLLFLTAFLLMIAVRGVRPLLLTAQIEHFGIIVQGNVTGSRTVQTGAHYQSMYYLKYNFADLSGAIYDVEQIVNSKTFEHFQMGDAVPVRYLPDNPALSALTSWAKDDTLTPGNIAVALTGGIGFLVGLGALWFLGWYIWREERLFVRGRLMMGHVLVCHARLENMPKNLDAEVRDPPLAGSYIITLSYTFRSPDGQMVKAVAKRQRNDLLRKALPKFGNPVAVLYRDNQHYKVL